VDIITTADRSLLMSRIRGKDTKPELTVRRLAHALGFRFRLHRRDLPGAPDLVFPRLHKVIFVHGCFWHRHSECRLAYSPKSNVMFWQAKFNANVVRDTRAVEGLKALGWHVHVIWECEISNVTDLSRRISRFLTDADQSKHKQRADRRETRLGPP